VRCCVPAEDTKQILQLVSDNRALSKDLEEVKGTLGQTENNFRATVEEKTVYHDQLSKTLNNLGNTIKELQGVLKKVELIYW
jgi:conjugal transfer/entry exclusion protein